MSTVNSPDEVPTAELPDRKRTVPKRKDMPPTTTKDICGDILSSSPEHNRPTTTFKYLKHYGSRLWLFLTDSSMIPGDGLLSKGAAVAFLPVLMTTILIVGTVIETSNMIRSMKSSIETSNMIRSMKSSNNSKSSDEDSCPKKEIITLNKIN
ncbi:hypothetical protein BGZ65_005961, partial [Modicella reniformis]